MANSKINLGRALIAAGLVISTAPFSSAFAKVSLSEIREDLTFGIDGEINTNAGYSSVSNDNYNLDDSFVSLSVGWKDKVKLVVSAKIQEFLKANNVEFNDDFEFAEFIRDAYIEIREVAGSPVAVVIGKQPMSFGQNVQLMPIFNNNPMSELQEIDEVFGFTVDLTEGLFGLFDRVELSVFETERGDLEIGRIDGASVRVSKMLTDQWLLTLSHAEIGNNHLSSGQERRTSIGLIGETTDGYVVGWAEAMYFTNNPRYENSNFGLTGGIMVRVHRTTNVVVEGTWISKELYEVALGANVALTENLTMGPEIRYRNSEANGGEVIFGVNVRYTFGNTGTPRNEDYLFDDE